MDEVKVYTDLMRGEAEVWKQQSGQLAAARGRIDALELGLVEAGVFIPLVTSYNDLIHRVRSRCDEGVTAMIGVGDTLGVVADTYDLADEKAARELKGYY